MSKIRYYTVITHIQKSPSFAPNAPLTSNFCGFSNWLWRNQTFKKSVMMLFQWRHRYYVTKLTSQDVFILGPSLSQFLATGQWNN